MMKSIVSNLRELIGSPKHMILAALLVVSSTVGGCAAFDVFSNSADAEYQRWQDSAEKVHTIEQAGIRLAGDLKEAVDIWRDLKERGLDGAGQALERVRALKESVKINAEERSAGRALASMAETTFGDTKARIEKSGGGWLDILGGVLGAVVGVVSAGVLGGKASVAANAIKTLVQAGDIFKSKNPKAAGEYLEHIRAARPASEGAKTRFKAVIAKSRL